MLNQDAKFVTPRGVALYPHLVTPDAFEGSLDYKVNLILNPESVGVQELLDSIQASAEHEFEKGKAELMAKGGKHIVTAKALELFVPFSPEYSDVGEETGNVILKAKSKASGISAKTNKPWERKIPLFDKNRKRIPHGAVDIWSGSVVKVEMQIFMFTAAGLKKSGCSLRIVSAQVLELSEGGGGGGAFGVEEGSFDAEGLSAPDAPYTPPVPEEGVPDEDF
jgi:hypothetical protein